MTDGTGAVLKRPFESSRADEAGVVSIGEVRSDSILLVGGGEAFPTDEVESGLSGGASPV